jgi:hypothetical protein
MKHPETKSPKNGHLRGGHDKTDWDGLMPLQQVSEKKDFS